jgi:hypothetical protein
MQVKLKARKRPRRRASEIGSPLPACFEEAETREQIRLRKGLTRRGVAQFLHDLDAQGILRAKRTPISLAGLAYQTIVYWVEE